FSPQAPPVRVPQPTAGRVRCPTLPIPGLCALEKSLEAALGRVKTEQAPRQVCSRNVAPVRPTRPSRPAHDKGCSPEERLLGFRPQRLSLGAAVPRSARP